MSPFSRRRFLGTTAVVLSALPTWSVAHALKRPLPIRRPLASDRPAIALIGCGGMGLYDAQLMSRHADIVALCDVDETRLAKAKEKHPKAATFRDFRECVAHPGLHGIINGTPDHWHTLVNLAAIRAGLDVYSEKPLTLTIDEGRRLVAAVKSTGAVLQTGSQQRSDKRFRLAVELVRNGRIGKLRHVTTSLPSGRHGGPFSPTPPPPGLDWNFWQGQTPAVPHVAERCHGSFRYWWDYSAGTLTDWGAHHNDIALWGIGLPDDANGPVAIEGHALREPVPGGFSFPSTYVVHYRYANGVTHTCRTVETENPSGGIVTPDTPPAQMPNGVLFEGNDGWIYVSRSRIAASRADILETPLGPGDWRATVSDDHTGNFIDCMRSRRDPVASAAIGHRSVSVCHLGAIAIRLGRPLRWDPVAERFDGDREANRWLARPMRRGFDYAML